MMKRYTWISRRIAIGMVLCALTLGGFLFQPSPALAGFGSSLGKIAWVTDGTSNT